MCLSCASLSQNLVVAVSAEGWLHLFDLTSTKALDASGHHETLGEEQRPVFKQHIPANTKVLLISDIGGHERPRSRGQWLSGRPQGAVPGALSPSHACAVCLLSLFEFCSTLSSLGVCVMHSY